MKKTLIALAAVAVSSAAMAQVSLTGKLRFAYESLESTTANVKTKASGIKVTDGDFALTAVEDLGGGLRATAFMNVQSRGRDTAISGRDAHLTLAGGFGSVMIGSVEIGNGIIGLGGAGAPVYGMDGSVIAGAGNADIIKYTSPALVPGLTASLSMIDWTVGSTSAPAVNATGGTLGMGSTAGTPDATVIGVNYAAGPLAAAADMTTYGKNASLDTRDDRVRMSASYDLGVAKLGFGYQVASTTAANNNETTDMILGVSVPLGATTVGLNYATSEVDGGIKVTGLDLGAKYDLSKRTFVAFHYQDVDKADNASAFGGTDAPANNNSNSAFRIQVGHSF